MLFTRCLRTLCAVVGTVGLITAPTWLIAYILPLAMGWGRKDDEWAWCVFAGLMYIPIMTSSLLCCLRRADGQTFVSQMYKYLCLPRVTSESEPVSDAASSPRVFGLHASNLTYFFFFPVFVFRMAFFCLLGSNSGFLAMWPLALEFAVFLPPSKNTPHYACCLPPSPFSLLTLLSLWYCVKGGVNLSENFGPY